MFNRWDHQIFGRYYWSFTAGRELSELYYLYGSFWKDVQGVGKKDGCDDSWKIIWNKMWVYWENWWAREGPT